MVTSCRNDFIDAEKTELHDKKLLSTSVLLIVEKPLAVLLTRISKTFEKRTPLLVLLLDNYSQLCFNYVVKESASLMQQEIYPIDSRTTFLLGRQFFMTLPYTKLSCCKEYTAQRQVWGREMIEKEKKKEESASLQWPQPTTSPQLCS